MLKKTKRFVYTTIAIAFFAFVAAVTASSIIVNTVIN